MTCRGLLTRGVQAPPHGITPPRRMGSRALGGAARGTIPGGYGT